MATETAVSVTIGGHDVSSSVISLTTEQDICRVAQTFEIALDPTSGSSFNPWNEVTVYIDGFSRLTGYVSEVVKGRNPTELIVRGLDKMKLALDMFVPNTWTPSTYLNEDVEVIGEPQDAGYWIDFWLTQAGITSLGAVETGYTIPVDFENPVVWTYTSVSDIILECLGYAGGAYIVYMDGGGIAKIKEKTVGASSHTFSEVISFSRSQDDSWLRDRAVVFGSSVVAEKPDDVSGCTRTVALSSPFVETNAAAEELAERLLTFFDTTLDIKRCEIVGSGSLNLGDAGSLSDSWSGYAGTGLVTSIETAIDDRGFRQNVSLDEKCGVIWGHGKPYGQIAFIIEGQLTEGDIGIWFVCGVPDGMTLRNTYSAVKTPPEGSSIGIRVQTSTNGSSWTTQSSHSIADGYRLSGKQETFAEDFIEEGTLVRFYITQVGSDDAGEDLTLSVGVKIGEM